MSKHVCPVCGYDGLEALPRTSSGGGSYEICPSCGFQFGVSDDDEGWTYEAWRLQWIEAGRKWSSVGINPPAGWDPTEQVARLGSPQERHQQCPLRSGMRITYDPKADAAYICLVEEIQPGGVARTYACDPREVKGQINLDFDSEGRLLGIEVLDASKKLPTDVLKGAPVR